MVVVMYNVVNVINATELDTWKWLTWYILYYFTTIQKKLQKKKKKESVINIVISGANSGFTMKF